MPEFSEEAVSQAEAAEPDECHKVLQRHFVQEWKILERLIEAMVSSNGDAPMPDIKKAQLIMEKYQEQGQLLEPYLERMVCPLMDILRNQVDDGGNPRIGPVKKVCSIIYTLVTVCGYKTVVKFFPHHASDLELAVTLLQVSHEEVEETSILREESTGQWETKCCLLLWLSILVLIPFDIASVDTSLAECDPTLSSGIPPLVERILMICKDYLASPGPMREMAGVLLSRLLTRPDMQVALQSFMQWSQGAILAALDNSTADFLVPGLIGAVAAIFKVGGSDILIQVTSTAWEEARQLFKSPIASRSLLLRKFLVKLIQRIGLVYLRPRTTWWRYKGTDSLIVQNLSFVPENKLDDISGGEVQQAFLSADIVSSGKVSKLQLDNVDHTKEDEEIDVPDIVEEIIDHLLMSLKDKDTVVRWSAAKGIGRITGRLTSSLADDVVASVLQLLNPLEGDGAWHGGCLALAELARRGLLIPSRVKDVVPLIIQALHYDVRRGSHSVGAHVRDAAAYVCWAFARAYSPVIMKEHLEKLAPVLLTIACYDREVNCRRAASAAFQENVGRQGDYPHGIDLVNAADYFSLASRSTSYCSVAVYVAQFSEYRLSLVQELVETKICHWDKGLRELAAEALALLVKYEPTYFGEHVLDSLLPSVLSTDLNLRHGATLAISETIMSLKNNGFVFSTEKEKALANIVPAIEKARLYRGKGGEIMRAAVSRLIECEALVRIPLPTKVLKANLETINENLKHPNGQIQACAVAALRAFIQSYMLPSNENTIQQITMKHLQILRQDVNPAAKRGSALALGSLPPCFLMPVWKDVIGTLCNACMVEESPEESDAETRVNSVRGLVAVCKNLFEAEDNLLQSTANNKDSLVSVMKEQVMDSLFKALDDYSVDNRGDVGSWVREAAIMGLEQIVGLLCRSLMVLPDSSKQLPTDQMDARDSEDMQELVLRDNKNDLSLNRDLAIRLIGGLVKQGLEKINRVRDTAGQSLRRILHNNAVTVPFVPHKEELQLLVPDDTSINWGAPDDAFPRLVPLLKFPEYTMYVMSGLVVSVGGLADSLGKISLKYLLEVLRDNDHLTAMKESTIEDSFHASNWLGGTLVSVLKTYAGVERVITPTFKTIDILFSKGAFQSIQTLEESHAAEILASNKLELKGSKDIVKIMAGISVLGHLALLPGSVGLQAISQLLGFLGHRYPKVRKACSEQVYLLLVQRGEELLQEDDLEAAQELVSESCWDGPLENISKEREVLARMFKLQNEVKESMEPDGSNKLVSRRAVRDENASYAALVSENR